MKLTRNQHRCEHCGTDSLKRLETATNKRAAARGVVVAVRVFRCSNCQRICKTLEISLGESAKAYARDRSDARGTVGYESDDSVVVEDLTHGLAVVRL